MPAATGTNPIVDSVDRRLPSFDEDPDRDLVASMLSYTTPDCILINFACGPISLLEKVVCVAKADLREACCPFSGYTALHFAAEMGVEENVRWMLDHGSAWNGRDRLGNRAIDLARKEGHQECSKFLFEYAVEKEYARYYLPYTTPPDEWDNPVDKDRTPQVEGYFKSVVMYTSPQQTAHDFAMVDMGTGTGVMMEWERPLMKETARLLLEGLPKGVRILNVGFGLGIIDTYFQENCPSNHTIIEAHPNCIDFMRKTRWFGERNVRILQGRWQDFLRPPSDTRNGLLNWYPKCRGRRLEGLMSSTLIPLRKGTGHIWNFISICQVCCRVQTRGFRSFMALVLTVSPFMRYTPK